MKKKPRVFRPSVALCDAEKRIKEIALRESRSVEQVIRMLVLEALERRK